MIEIRKKNDLPADRQEKLEIAISAAVAAGNILLERSDDLLRKQHSKESLRDTATEIDLYAEKKIIEILKDTKYPILAEESGVIGKINNSKKDKYWVVDPLDGTVNYINHIPFYAVSIAFIEDGFPSVGVVYNPLLNELFYGAKGFGVYKNNKKIITKDKNPEESLFTAAFSGKKYNSDRKKEYISFGVINDNSMGCLRSGSAAMNLAYVAEGKFGGAFGKLNKIWDVAAGILLAKEAGAKVCYEIVDEKENLVNYITSTPSSMDFIKKHTGI